MDWFDRVIIGSGPAGVAAARRMEDGATCLIDVGDLPQNVFPFPSLRDALDCGEAEHILGMRWEMLANLVDPVQMHPKLRAAALRFVLRGEPVHIYGSSGEVLLNSKGSHAAGGMSNVWGAQLLRYTDEDLLEAGEWPFSTSALQPYYADLESHIGISGAIDDMQVFLGGAEPQMPPVPMVPAAEYLYRRYSSQARTPLLLGRPRLALITEPYAGRSPHKFGETEFFTSGQEGLYTARTTLDELKGRGRIAHIDRHQLLGWRESAEYVELDLMQVDNGQHRTVRTRHLLLGCGTVQTARLVLRHYDERGRTLPFLDHPPALLPIVLPRMLGSKLPTTSYPIQLIGTLQGTGRRDMISFYYPGGMLWSDLVLDVPLPINATVRILRALLGGMLVAQIWQTSRPSPCNRLCLSKGDGVVIHYSDRSPCSAVPHLLTALRSLGAYSVARLASLSPPGWGFHYAGSLPMRRIPSAYETHVDGRLWSSRRVRVIDGSVLPTLPAKNHTLTLMANAARIADEVMRCGY